VNLRLPIRVRESAVDAWTLREFKEELDSFLRGDASKQTCIGSPSERRSSRTRSGPPRTDRLITGLPWASRTQIDELR